MEKKLKKPSKLAIQLVVGFLLLGMTVASTNAYVGYRIFKEQIFRQYHTKAYEIAEVAQSMICDEHLPKYYEIAKKISQGEIDLTQDPVVLSEDYREIQNRISNLKEQVHANDIFLVYVNVEELLSYEKHMDHWTPLTYIYDAGLKDSKKADFGEQGFFNPKFIEEAYQILETKERSDNYFISQGEYGYNTSALLPISDFDEVLILGVEIPMRLIRQSIQTYLTYAVGISVTLMVLFIIGYLIYFYIRILKPLQCITREVGFFVENGVEVSEPLKKIRLRNEIGDLSQGIVKLEKDVIRYICDLTKITTEQERYEAELNVASQIQLAMCPNRNQMVRTDSVELFSWIQPARLVGGDFYDFFDLDDTHLAMIVADVSGKGVPAALFMMRSKTLLKEYLQSTKRLDQSLNQVNRLLCESNPNGLFLTVFAGILDLESGVLRWINAGHEYPMIESRNRNFEVRKTTVQFVLAGMEETRYFEEEMILKEEDVIFLYTDGIVEASDENHRFFGMERLRESLLSQTDSKNCQKITEQVQKDLSRFVGQAVPFDDMTIFCLKFKRKKV